RRIKPNAALSASCDRGALRRCRSTTAPCEASAAPANARTIQRKLSLSYRPISENANTQTSRLAVPSRSHDQSAPSSASLHAFDTTNGAQSKREWNTSTGSSAASTVAATANEVPSARLSTANRSASAPSEIAIAGQRIVAAPGSNSAING